MTQSLTLAPSYSDLHDIIQPPGIYVALLLSSESKKKIAGFCENVLSIDMSNSQSPYEHRSHSTVFSAYETNGTTVEDVSLFMEDKTFVVRSVKWDIFTSDNTGKRCLVLNIESDELIAFHHHLAKKSGLQHSFNTYSPHISVHYDYKGDIPTHLPEFLIELQEMYTKPYFFKFKKPSLRKEDKYPHFSSKDTELFKNNHGEKILSIQKMQEHLEVTKKIHNLRSTFNRRKTDLSLELDEHLSKTMIKPIIKNNK